MLCLRHRSNFCALITQCIGLANRVAQAHLTLYFQLSSCTNYIEVKMSLKAVIPTVKAQEAAEEEDLVDPQQVLRDQCKDHKGCASLGEKYQACNDRVNSRSKTAEICNEELFDYLHCVDHCVTKDLFSRLK